MTSVLLIAITPLLICLWAIFKKPFLGLVLFSFLMPLEGVFVFLEYFTFGKLISLYVVVLFIIAIILNRKKIKIDVIFIILLLICAWGLITSFWVSNFDAAIYTFITLLLICGNYLLFINYCDTKEKIVYIIIAFVMGLSMAGIMGINNIIEGVYLHPLGRFSTAQGFNINRVALNLAAGLIMIGYFWSQNKTNNMKYLLFPPGVLLLGLFILTQSRTYWIAFFLVILVSIMWLFEISIQKKTGIILCIVLTIFGVFSFININFPVYGYFIAQRSQSIFSAEDINNSRGEIWKGGIRMFLSHPLAGVGLGSFTDYYLQYAENASDLSTAFGAHNTSINILAEQGLIGYLLWLILFWFSLKNIMLIRNKIDKKAAYVFLFFTFFIFLFGMDDHYKKAFWLALTLPQLLFVSDQKVKETSSEQ